MHPDTSPYGTWSLDKRQLGLLRFAQSRQPTWLGRRLALLARRIVLSGRALPIDAEAEGFRLRVHVGDNVSERKFLFMPRFCDPVERAYLVRHLSPDGTFLDIGANAGLYTLTAARAYAGLAGKGGVLAVEANPVMQQRLRFNIDLNDLGAHVDLAPIALSDHVGEVEFSISDSNLGESGLLPTGGNAIRVACQTLHGLLVERGVSVIDGMKIDVEGMEDTILNPFLDQAPRSLWPRFIIIENSAARWRTDLPGRLERAGYRTHMRAKMNSILTLADADSA